MIGQGEFYEHLTQTITPLALRDSIREARGDRGLGNDISTWVCDFICSMAAIVNPQTVLQGTTNNSPCVSGQRGAGDNVTQYKS